MIIVSFPTDPVVEIDVFIAVWSDADGGVLIVFAEEEAVDVSLYLGELHLGQLTVSVIGDDGIAHTVGNAELLPHLHSTVHRDVG